MKVICISSLLILSTFLGKAQKFEVNKLKYAVGYWEGTLTYLDYSSGKPYSMLANIRIGLTDNKKGFIMEYEYPKEPHANSKDTSYVKDDVFGMEKIVSFNRKAKGDFMLITEKEGEDGNEHKKAMIRHTYRLADKKFSIKKEVKFQGTDTWIKRHEYEMSSVKSPD